ncbi:MAG: single-stranded-DNA-specific exonuclease RecJ, partial [Elusimicrobiota bacterium]|nr:single-stranded-DNA-specific exonuclease RecJ [Elusimicrobiota bacterium]
MEFGDKIWKFVNEGAAKSSKEIKFQVDGLHPKLLQILVSRGIDSQEKVEIFLNGGLQYLHNPFLFKQAQKAVERIRKAIDLKEFILVYGDRDVDGITAVNIIVDTIKRLGGIVQWYVPADEGYGIHKDILSQYKVENVKVLITVDCGISAKEEIEYAKSLGIDVILTDHHEPVEDTIPSPYACIDSKLKGTKYPFKDIAGCAVSLKLAQALIMTYNRQYNKYNLLFTADKDGEDFKGEFSWICNDVLIEQKSFHSIEELRKEIKAAHRVYTFSSQAAAALIKKDILLRDKIIIFEDEGKKDLRSLFYRKVKIDYSEERLTDFFESNLDICALGTIADSMPLLDENRIIVREGLKIIASNPHCRPGLGLLIEDTLKTKDSYNITAQSISWNVTPVLNSSGRMGRGSLSAQLLITRDKFQAQTLYTDIIKLNSERRGLQLENIWQFKTLLKEQCDSDKDKVLIVKASNLEHGVTGIIAAHIVKTYSKPAFLLISDGNEAIGAVRSIEGFNIIDALESVKDILIKYGGHNQAAGFTIENSKIDEFKKRIMEYADKKIGVIESLNAI